MKKCVATARGFCCALLALSLPWLARAEPGRTLYRNDFEKAALDQAPDDFLVLEGEFAVKQGDGNKYLELPGSPLDTFGALFGSSTNAGVTVSARIYGTAKGRRSPSFGVGLNGANGFILKVSPGKNALEIYQGDVAAAGVPFQWKSGAWTMFRLRVRAVDGAWKVEGRAWTQTDAEPKEWMISLDEKTAPHDGRPSIWGSPYSGTPIRFDDLAVTAE